jgi:alkylhydroperoxidase family enzyme
MQKPDVDALHAAGCDDGEILEVNQVCAYFNYSNRLLNGLGVTTEGDVIGYYKENDKQEAT